MMLDYYLKMADEIFKICTSVCVVCYVLRLCVSLIDEDEARFYATLVFFFVSFSAGPKVQPTILKKNTSTYVTYCTFDCDCDRNCDTVHSNILPNPKESSHFPFLLSPLTVLLFISSFTSS